MNGHGRTITQILAAALSVMAGGAQAQGPEAEPIRLVAETTDAGVTLQVVGQSPAAMSAGYALEVASGASSGNRSSQSGVARLRPGERVVLLTTRLGGAAGEDWTAKLTVRPDGGAPYERTRSAADQAE